VLKQIVLLLRGWTQLRMDAAAAQRMDAAAAERGLLIPTLLAQLISDKVRESHL
jgi:hypothetical protein